MSKLSLSRRDFLKMGASLSLGGLVAVMSGKANLQARREISGKQPNILIIVLDTLTARNMSTYGYSRQTTPNISRFAEQAVVYHNHQSAGNYTPPGTASILTGAYPWSHRALHTSGSIRQEFVGQNVFSQLVGDYHTLAYTHNSLAMSILFKLQDSLSELLPFETLTLQENTFSTSCLWKDFRMADWSETIIRGVGHPPASLYLSLLDPLRMRPNSDIVDLYSGDFPRGIPSANLDSRYFVLEDAVDWLGTNLDDLPTPNLVYFHLMPPHEPYTPRKEYIGAFLDDKKFPQKPKHFFSNYDDEAMPTLRREYDEYLAYADAEFGRLLDLLSESGAHENTCLVLTSDHGQLFERGIHGHITPTLYAPLLHVPLLISRPGQRKREDVYVVTSAVDLAPTLLHMVGKEIPDWMEGQVLPGFGDSIRGRGIYALEAKESDLSGPLHQGTIALIKDRFKLIYYFGYPGFDDQYELYDWEADPEELTNLYNDMPGIAQDLANEIHQVLRVKGLRE
jgi:arylsulfatase A-like enzyme